MKKLTVAATLLGLLALAGCGGCGLGQSCASSYTYVPAGNGWVVTPHYGN